MENVGPWGQWLQCEDKQDFPDPCHLNDGMKMMIEKNVELRNIKLVIENGKMCNYFLSNYNAMRRSTAKTARTQRKTSVFVCVTEFPKLCFQKTDVIRYQQIQNNVVDVCCGKCLG